MAGVGLTRSSVRILHGVLRNLLNAAVDDGLIVGNPADKLGRVLRLAQSPKARAEEIKAMDRAQLSTFLKASATPDRLHGRDRRYFPLFLVLARTGLRLGEGLALQWDDLDLAARSARIERSYSGRTLGTPKSGYGRMVDLSQDAVAVLRRLQVERKAQALQRGWGRVPEWVFCSTTGSLLEPRKVGLAFRQALKRAGLPPHFTPHGLRHSYASQLLQAGVSSAYVQRQLGHASITLTVDTYGRWLPMENKAAVDALDEGSGSKVVAAPAARAGNPHEIRGLVRTGSIVQ